MPDAMSDYLVQLIAKQVDEKGLVVWYDPEEAYGTEAAKLNLPGTTVARYDGSFLKLRKEVDHLMADAGPPRLVVYVPMSQSDAQGALIELEAAGIVMRPGQQPPNRNTKLAVVARNALRTTLGDDHVVGIEKQVEAGKLSLADLNALANKGKDISTGILSLIFGSANPQEVALAVLHSDRYDTEIEKKSAQKELANLLTAAFDFEPQMNTDEHGLKEEESVSISVHPWLNQFRERLGRHVLLTDLVTGFGDEVPSALASIKLATSPVGVDSCRRLARSWRNNRDFRESYVTAANKVERDFSLDQIVYPFERFADNETLHAVEQSLLRDVENQLLDSATGRSLKLAAERQSRFWAEVVPAIQARWALVAAAGEVLLEADRVAQELKNPPTTMPDFVAAYAESPEPWCLLDTHHRHMESRRFNFEFSSTGEHRGLDKLIAKAEHRYNETGSGMAQQFITCLEKASPPIKGLLRQRDFFATQVKPALAEGKVAYVWVDALRFEMARELGRLLTEDFDLSIRPAIGTVPTITEIGMAALLPKANEAVKIVGVGGGKLALEIGGTVIKDRKDRVAFLKEHAGVPVFDCKLDDLLPKPGKKVREGIENAQLVLVTSQEIDELCEADNIAQARLQMDGVLSHLRRGVRILADHGIKKLVLVADHGHLFADEIGEDMKIDAPGGKTEDLHRRVWVGVGGTSEPSYLRAPLRSFGVESDFDIATPWSFACFKSKGGARAYFHGGLSPQELIVPLVLLTARAKTGVATTGIQWTLVPGTAKLTTRFFSVQVGGTQSQASMFGFQPPKVRVELRANKKCISTPVSASYGFEDATGEVSLKASAQEPKRIEPNTVTLMIMDTPVEKTVSIHLVDAVSLIELASKKNVPVAISI